MKQSRAKKVTLESLAGMVANGFAEQEKKITENVTERVTERVTEKITVEIKGLESRLSQQISGINNRLDDLALNRATREELYVLDQRVVRIESKLGLNFKKETHA